MRQKGTISAEPKLIFFTINTLQVFLDCTLISQQVYAPAPYPGLRATKSSRADMPTWAVPDCCGAS
jgi:hypothetical protein